MLFLSVVYINANYLEIHKREKMSQSGGVGYLSAVHVTRWPGWTLNYIDTLMSSIGLTSTVCDCKSP